MNQEVKALWTEALLSGEFEQAQGALCRIQPDRTSRYCCLGVLSELAAQRGIVERQQEAGLISYGDHTSYLPAEVIEWAELPDSDPTVEGRWLSHWNDKGALFPEIARMIDEHL